MIFVPSHIPNLDEILEGASTKPSIVLVAGAAAVEKQHSQPNPFSLEQKQVKPVFSFNPFRASCNDK